MQNYKKLDPKNEHLNYGNTLKLNNFVVLGVCYSD